MPLDSRSKGRPANVALIKPEWKPIFSTMPLDGVANMPGSLNQLVLVKARKSPWRRVVVA